MDNRSSLQDIINYVPEDYLSEAEISVIRATFKDNEKLLHILRKIFLPMVIDPELPIEQIGNDVWLAGKDWDAIGVNEAKALIVARQDAIRFVSGGIIKLKVIANQAEESEEQKRLRESKDSVE